MPGICDGRVTIVTGAGRGLGRAHALELARQGAKVVVNDVGVALDGTGGSTTVAATVVDEIRAAGGEAIASTDDVADWEAAGRLVAAAVDTWGRLDVLVNNAGILRDRMLVNMDVEEWEAVMRVHLRGTFCATRRAAEHWRARAKSGEQVDARIVGTTSSAGLFGHVGQANYVAAKAGVVGLVLVAAAELGRYGVTANALAPGARTRMTELAFPDAMTAGEGDFDRMAPEHVSPMVAWLASADSAGVTGRIFEVYGGRVGVVNGHTSGPTIDRARHLAPDELGPLVRGLLEEADDPIPVQGT